jgi:hypothetical protein
MDLFSVLRFFIRFSLSFEIGSTNLEFSQKLPKIITCRYRISIGKRPWASLSAGQQFFPQSESFASFRSSRFGSLWRNQLPAQQTSAWPPRCRIESNNFETPTAVLCFPPTRAILLESGFKIPPPPRSVVYLVDSESESISRPLCGEPTTGGFFKSAPDLLF